MSSRLLWTSYDDMSTFPEIRALICETYGVDSDPERVVDCIAKFRVDPRMVTPAMLANSCGGDKKAYLAGLIALSAPRTPLFAMRYAVEDEDGAFFTLDDEYVDRYLADGQFYHPILGTLIPEPATAVIVYFEPTDELLQCLKNRAR